MMEVEAGGRRVEVEDRPGTAVGAPPLVLLHEGLGCVALWRDLPERLARATGSRVVAWSRYGHGGSEVLEGHREPGYMHDEALVALPELRDLLGVGRPVLVGHSDGASIALIHAGARRWPVAGVVLLAPHVFVEEASLAGIAGARRSYRDTDLRQRLARYHRDPDATFYGWADVWLSEAFSTWNVEDSLAGVDCPVLVMQGTDDPYGTLAQVDAVAAGVTGPVTRLVLPGCGHAPHLDRPEETLAAIVDHVAAVRSAEAPTWSDPLPAPGGPTWGRRGTR